MKANQLISQIVKLLLLIIDRFHIHTFSALDSARVGGSFFGGYLISVDKRGYTFRFIAKTGFIHL